YGPLELAAAPAPERPEYRPQSPTRPAQTSPAKALLSDAGQKTPVPAAAAPKPPIKTGLRASTAIPETIPERASDPKAEMELRVREALLAGVLDRVPRTPIALQSALLTSVSTSIAIVKKVMGQLIAEGVAEKRASGTWTRYCLKPNFSPARAG